MTMRCKHFEGRDQGTTDACRIHCAIHGPVRTCANCEDYVNPLDEYWELLEDSEKLTLIDIHKRIVKTLSA